MHRHPDTNNDQVCFVFVTSSILNVCFMCVGIGLHVRLHSMCALGLRRPEENVRSPGIGDRDVCKLIYGC